MCFTVILAVQLSLGHPIKTPVVLGAYMKQEGGNNCVNEAFKLIQEVLCCNLRGDCAQYLLPVASFSVFGCVLVWA